MDELTAEQQILQIDRPHPDLLKYYLVTSPVWGPFFPFAALFRYMRYRTIRYHFDAEGVTMRWGSLVRREVSLAYSRIQDIHLSSGLIERWLGLARIEIQTASGGTQAELTLEGLIQYQAVRDYLYAKMRGATADDRHANAHPPVLPPLVDSSAAEALTQSLHAVAEELRATRVLLQQTRELREDTTA